MYRATLAAQCQVTYRSPIFVGASKVSLAFATQPFAAEAGATRQMAARQSNMEPGTPHMEPGTRRLWPLYACVGASKPPGYPLVVPSNATRHMETASGAPGRSFLSRQA